METFRRKTKDPYQGNGEYLPTQYPDGWWITFFSEFQGKRVRVRGPYKKKSFAELDIEKLNQKTNQKP